MADHHATRPGQSLQARRHVWCLANHRLLARCPLANEVTHHRLTGGDPHARLETNVRVSIKLGDRLHQRARRAHRPFGIVLVRLRPAEVGQDAIAQELGDVAFEPADDLGARRVIGPHHIAQVLGVEPRRQLRRADQVAEQHRQLTALGFRNPRAQRARLRHGPRYRRLLVRFSPQRLDGLQELQPRAEGQAEILEMLLGQFKQRFAIDLVLFERIGEASEAVRLEPRANVPHLAHRSSSSSALASLRSGVSKPSVNQP